MKNKIINILIIIWALAITLYTAKNVYDKIIISKFNEKSNYSTTSRTKIDLDLKISNGNETTLGNIIMDKKTNNIFIIFFLPSCEPCISELKQIQNLINMNLLEVEPIVIGIGELETIQNYIDKKGIRIKVYAISPIEYKEKLNNNPVPLNIVLDKTGNVKFSQTFWNKDKKSINLFIKKVNSLF